MIKEKLAVVSNYILKFLPKKFVYIYTCAYTIMKKYTTEYTFIYRVKTSIVMVHHFTMGNFRRASNYTEKTPNKQSKLSWLISLACLCITQSILASIQSRFEPIYLLIFEEIRTQVIELIIKPFQLLALSQHSLHSFWTLKKQWVHLNQCRTITATCTISVKFQCWCYQVDANKKWEISLN